MSRHLRLLVVTAGLVCLVALPAWAQEAGEEVVASSGNPLYGYLSTAFLGAGILFVLCKSSRR